MLTVLRAAAQGTDWGEQGYMRMLRHEASGSPGMCGVALMPVYPVVD